MFLEPKDSEDNRHYLMKITFFQNTATQGYETTIFSEQRRWREVGENREWTEAHYFLHLFCNQNHGCSLKHASNGTSFYTELRL